MKCTWKGCNSKGIYDHYDNNGKQYACLCLGHENKLDKAIDEYSRTKDDIKFQTLLKYILVDSIAGSIKTGILEKESPK